VIAAVVNIFKQTIILKGEQNTSWKLHCSRLVYGWNTL